VDIQKQTRSKEELCTYPLEVITHTHTHTHTHTLYEL